MMIPVFLPRLVIKPGSPSFHAFPASFPELAGPQGIQKNDLRKNAKN
jgi:hypothetical protein